MNRLVRLLPAVTLVAVLVVTATSEFRLAVDVLALPVWVAWGVPAAVDSYVVAAVRTRRDVAPAMAVMAISLFAAAGSHIIQARSGDRLPIQVTGPASAAMLSVLVLVAWRVHVLIDRLAEPDEQDPQTSAPAVQQPAVGAEPLPLPKVVQLVDQATRAAAAAERPAVVTAPVPEAIEAPRPARRSPQPAGSTRQKVAELLKQNPAATATEIAEAVGVKRQTVDYHLTALRKETQTQ